MGSANKMTAQAPIQVSSATAMPMAMAKAPPQHAAAASAVVAERYARPKRPAAQTRSMNKRPAIIYQLVFRWRPPVTGRVMPVT